MKRLSQNVAYWYATPVASRVVTDDWEYSIEPIKPVGEVGRTAEEWWRITGPGTPVPIELRLGLREGVPAVLGLRIDGDVPITSATLRQIRLRPLVAELVDFFGGLREFFATGAAEGDEVYDFLEFELGMWLDAVADAQTELLESGKRKRGAAPPTQEQYRAFAKAYLEEHSLGHRGAKNRVARRLHMDRVTVYRWAKAARELGLLPEDEKGVES